MNDFYYAPYTTKLIWVEQPKRPRGKWKDNRNGTFICDQCGCKHSRSNFCPDCGADMRSKIVGKHADFMMIDEAVAKGADDED